MRIRVDATSSLSESGRRQTISGILLATGAWVLSASELPAQEGGEISHTAESIHQEVKFQASRKHVYEALTDAKQFERVVQLSDAAKTMIKPGAPVTQISTEAGGAFSTFGGLIVGRQLELVPGENRPGSAPGLLGGGTLLHGAVSIDGSRTRNEARAGPPRISGRRFRELTGRLGQELLAATGEISGWKMIGDAARAPTGFCAPIVS